MKELQLKDNKSALVVVAHPDDETIWMGGTIMKHPAVNWTVFSLCRASDADRQPKFRRVMERLGAQGIITDLDDEDKLSLEETIPVIKELIAKHITAKIDYLFFHGPNGEYGHPRHIGVHRAIKEMLSDKQLKAESAFFFNYRPDDPEAEFSTLSIKADTDFIVKLTQEELQTKKQIVGEMYGYPADGPDVNFCTKEEGFKMIKQ